MKCGATALTLVASVVPSPVSAQETEDEDACTVLCAPELGFEPTLTVENAFGAPRVQDLSNGEVARAARDVVFEAVMALGVPTASPYVGLTFEAILKPFEQENEPELEAELNLFVLQNRWTGGWAEAHFDIVGQVSPAERPGARHPYTPKLDFELDLAAVPFHRLQSVRWLRGVETEVSFDYLATGLARRGDVVDGRRYLDDASGWSISFVLVLPVAPLNR